MPEGIIMSADALVSNGMKASAGKCSAESLS